MNKKDVKTMIKFGSMAVFMASVAGCSYYLTEKLVSVAIDRKMPKALEKTRESIAGSEKLRHIYDMQKAKGNDLYEVFLSGPISLLTIENPNAESERELIVFRDSFASSLAPLLAEGYAKITLADIRYLPAVQMGKLLDFHGQDVLLLYSAAVLNNSDTLK